MSSSIALDEAEEAEIQRALDYRSKPRASRTRLTEVRLPPKPGVYFVQIDAHDRPIKIGVAKNMHQRIGVLQTSLPWKLVAIGYVLNAGEAYERELHARFAAYRMRGEWFMSDQALLFCVRSLTRGAT